MKDHFDKIIVERPRFNSRGPNNKATKPKDLDSAPKKESMKGAGGALARSWCKKELNENLNPLYRFLDKQIGRPWDKVYSEMRAHIKPGNTVQEHILGHLEDHIVMAKDVVVIDGMAMYKDGRYNYKRGAIINHLYVDPVDGIIKKKIKRQEPAKKVKKPTWKAGGKVAVCHAGIWYEVLLGDIKADTTTQDYYSSPDPVTGVRQTIKHAVLPTDILYGTCDATLWGRTNTKLAALYGIAGVYGKTRRQMNSKEIKRLVL